MPQLPDDSMLPDWAVAKADASLKIGLSVPEIEQRLVAQGLSPLTAAAVVNSILENRLRESMAPREQSEQRRFVHQLVSAVVGCACLLLAYWFGGGLSAARTLLGILLPLGCIWYPEVMDWSAPPEILRWVAWLVLILIGGYRILLLLL